jgi:hypothetical protein
MVYSLLELNKLLTVQIGPPTRVPLICHPFRAKESVTLWDICKSFITHISLMSQPYAHRKARGSSLVGCPQLLTPYVCCDTPYVGAVTPYVGAVAPYVGAVTPYVGAVTPYVGAVTPYVGAVSSIRNPNTRNAVMTAYPLNMVFLNYE